MKLLKLLTIGTLAAALSVTSASAATELHIAGSTAFRAAVTAAIVNFYNGNYSVAYSGTTTSSTAVFGASAAVFTGTYSGNPVTIKTYWTGSLAGVVDLSLKKGVTSAGKWFPADPGTNGITVATGPTGVNLPTNWAVDSSAPDVAMSDSYYQSVATEIASANVSPAIVVGTSTYTSGQKLSAAILAAKPADGGDGQSGGATASPVGIVLFSYVAGNQTGTFTAASNAISAPPFTNITTTVAQNLIAGPVPVSLIPGNTDSTGTADFVYLVGRNEDSGTRIDTFTAAYGGYFPPGITQEQLTFASGSAGAKDSEGAYVGNGVSDSVNGGDAFQANWPLNTEPSISWSASGHSGYVSGGNVATVLSAYNNPSALPGSLNNAPGENSSGSGYIIGYLGLADALSVYNGTYLNYNGVAADPANVANGTYQLWSEEHLYYLPGISSSLKTLADAVADQLYAKTACTNASTGVPAASTAISDEQAVKSNNKNGVSEYNMTGVFLQTSSVYTVADGAPYQLNY